VPALKLIVQVFVDDVEASYSPIIRRVNVTEDQSSTIQQAADNNTTSFHQLASATMGTAQVAILTFDQALNFKFNNASYLPMNANGVLVIFGADIAAGASTNITVNNPAASTAANIAGTVAGT